MNSSTQRRREHGFTLIEILVVMAIIGMLAVMVAPNIFNQQASAKRDAALSQISTLEAALDTYRLDVGSYPDSLERLMEELIPTAPPGMVPICAVPCHWTPGVMSMCMKARPGSLP